jgi:hypothetical protein
MKKNYKNLPEQLPGQLTLWDIEITKKPEEVTEKPVSSTKAVEKIEKINKSFTEQQAKAIDKYKTSSELNRIIYYCGRGVGIELQYENTYKTIYVNTRGEEEFTLNRKTPILPMDEILYYKTPEARFNNTQEERLKDLLQKTPDAKVIKRKGDDNILLEYADKVVSINSIGWVLEFKGCKAVYKEDELIGQQDHSPEVGIKDIQRHIKLGDIIEAQYGQRLIKGEIVHIYGPGNETLNIVFDNGTKHTAVHKSRVIKLIKCA